MTKYVLDDYAGPELDYSTLGFRANVGDILSATGAPDARWSVNGDQGAAETVDRYTLGGDGDYVEPTDGHVLTYSDTANTYVPLAPATFLADNLDGPLTAVDADAASIFRVQQDARLSATFARITATDGSGGLGAPTGEGVELVFTAGALEDIRIDGVSA